MYLKDSYDIPSDVRDGEHSPAFEKFLRNWFGNSMELVSGQLDITFLKDLTSEELVTARDLLRRNLKPLRNHIIEGTAALNDVDAAPLLRSLLREPGLDLSRRLTIAGALWKLTCDPIFPDLLREGLGVRDVFRGGHLYQVLWLDDERAVDFLFDLLKYKDKDWALALLNRLEFGRSTIGLTPLRDMRHQADYYQNHRNDPALRAVLLSAIQKYNREPKNGSAGSL